MSKANFPNTPDGNQDGTKFHLVLARHSLECISAPLFPLVTGYSIPFAIILDNKKPLYLK